MNRAKSRIPDYFVSLPAAEVIVESVPKIEEQAGYSRYAGAPRDGSRPAVYYQNIYRPETKNKAAVETVAFHEAYPGHHLQTAVILESLDLHPVIDLVSLQSYVEGWGVYTQVLTNEMGLYSSEKNWLFVISFNPHLLGGPLIIDSGIHHLGWTRDEAVDYIVTHLPPPLPKDTPGEVAREMAAAQVDFMTALPAYGLNYGVGYGYFMKLRNEAEEALGSDFDIKEFHDECLKYGKVPFPFLETRIQAWVEGKKQEREAV